MGKKQAGARKKHYRTIYENFRAPVSSAHDCGKYCAPLNGGTPVCCDHDHAIPAASPPEWKVMQKRTDMWKRHKPKDAQAKREVAEIEETCVAIVCNGAKYCERDNRLLACRAFPFYPYFTKDGEFAGLAYYWVFEDRCWVISNIEQVDKTYVKEFIESYDMLTDVDEGEYLAFHEQSASMRRVFSRRGMPIPLIGLEGEYLQVLPKSGGKIVPADPKKYPKFGPYRSRKAYEKAAKESEEIYGPPEWGEMPPFPAR